MITSYSRGHKIYYKNGKWYYCDTDEEYKDQRPCKKCGNYPTEEGHDYCLGNLEGVESACCGHGVEEGYIKKVEIKPLEIPKVEKIEMPIVAMPAINIPDKKPTTAAQIIQFYRSEQWKELSKRLEKVSEEIKKELGPIIKALSEVAIRNKEIIVRIYIADPGIKKCYGIYKRTRKKRIRKKQMTRIYKKIGRYVENESRNN